MVNNMYRRKTKTRKEKIIAIGDFIFEIGLWIVFVAVGMFIGSLLWELLKIILNN